MNKYLSVIFLYNKASHKKLLLIAGSIPLCFLAIFLLRIGDPHEAGSYLLMERAFGGAWAVLPLVTANLLGMLLVANSLNGRKALKGSGSTTGYTMRRLRLSPISAYLTVFVYYFAVILIFWGVAIASLYGIGKMGLTMAGASGLDTKLALGLLRSEIGHALIPMFIVWAYMPENSYILVAVLIIALYAALSFADVISREKRPKGDPFKVNKHDGIVDLDSMEHDDEIYMEANRPVETDDSSSAEASLLRQYGRDVGDGGSKVSQKMDLSRPIGSSRFMSHLCHHIKVQGHTAFPLNFGI